MLRIFSIYEVRKVSTCESPPVATNIYIPLNNFIGLLFRWLRLVFQDTFSLPVPHSLRQASRFRTLPITLPFSGSGVVWLFSARGHNALMAPGGGRYLAEKREGEEPYMSGFTTPLPPPCARGHIPPPPPPPPLATSAGLTI